MHHSSSPSSMKWAKRVKPTIWSVRKTTITNCPSYNVKAQKLSTTGHESVISWYRYPNKTWDMAHASSKGFHPITTGNSKHRADHLLKEAGKCCKHRLTKRKYQLQPACVTSASDLCRTTPKTKTGHFIAASSIWQSRCKARLTRKCAKVCGTQST